MSRHFIDYSRGGYGFRYYFNAGINRETGACDEEGIEVYDEDISGGYHLIATIPTSKTIQDVRDMTDAEFDNFLAENGVL